MPALRSLLLLACLAGLGGAARVGDRSLAQMLAREKLKAQMRGASDGVCGSWGDTHMYPFGGQYAYDIQSPTPFLLTRYDPGDKKYRFEAQATQVYAAWGGNTVDNHFGIRCGLDILMFSQPRNLQRVSAEMNGKPISINRQKSELWPSAPNGRGMWYIQDQSPDGNWDTFEISCGFDEFSNQYASGFKIMVTWYRGGGNTNVIYGNARVDASDRYAWKLNGACGWLPGGVHPSTQRWIMDVKASFFGLTAADHAKEAKEGRGVSDKAKLLEEVNKCKAAIKTATGLDTEKIPERLLAVDKNIKTHIDDYVNGCAIDNYFGAPHDPSDMNKQVCEWVKSVNSALWKQMNEIQDKIETCTKPFVNPQEQYAPLLQEKFIMDQYCNKDPPRAPAAMPKFANCAEKEAEENGKKQAEQEAKKREEISKEENAKVLKKQEEDAKTAEQTAKQNAIKEERQKRDDKIKLDKDMAARHAQEKKEKRDREQGVKNKDEQTYKKRWKDADEEHKKKVQDPNGDFMNQKTSIIMLK